jgi:hypothetical protein
MSGVVRRFESKSKPGTYHTVQRAADGSLYCSCRAWINQKIPAPQRSCTHTKTVELEQTILEQAAAQALPQPAPDPSTVVLTEEEKEMACQGRHSLIMAIKMLRERTHLGLREAKLLIEECQRQAKAAKVPRRRGAFWNV